MRVCYFGTYRAAYVRNRILIEGLRRNGVEVVECHATLWRGVEDRVEAASGGWLKPSFWLRVLEAYGSLLRRYRQVGPYDVLVVGYPGQYDVFLARLLAWLRRKPLAWDVLNSMYLIATERGITRRHPATGWVIRTLERWAARLPDLMILDAQPFVDWWRRLHGTPLERFRLVPIGAEDDVFRQVYEAGLVTVSPHAGSFLVLYYGTYIPNHGVETIVEAARLLSGDASIRFEMVGDGPDREKAARLAGQYRLENLAFIDWMEKEALARRIGEAGVVLGTFGDTLQASLTNNNKIYEGFALGKAVISGETPSLPPSLHHGEHLYLCPRGDPQALAEAIRRLQCDSDLRRRLGENGRRILYEQFDVNHIGQVFAGHLRELVARRVGRS